MLRNVINQPGHNSKYNNTTGTYHVRNKEKYAGKYEPIYKSKLEAKMMFYLDHNESVVKWNYEAFPIKYVDESTNERKVRNYFIDFVAVVKSGSDSLQTVWIEVKSESETKPPGRKASKNPLAMQTWLKNQSKWKAARALAESRGHKFVVISEKELDNG